MHIVHIVLFLRPHKGIRLYHGKDKKIVSTRSYVNFISDNFIRKSSLREIKLEENKELEKKEEKFEVEKNTKQFFPWILTVESVIARLRIQVSWESCKYDEGTRNEKYESTEFSNTSVFVQVTYVNL